MVSAGIVAYSAPVKRDYPAVLSDLNDIASQTAALNTSLKNLSDTSPNLQSALSIDAAAKALNTTLEDATSDAKVCSSHLAVPRIISD